MDGDQHYLDKRIIKHDKQRTEKLKNLGWITFRIKWSDYQRLNFDQKKEFVKQFIEKIKQYADTVNSKRTS